MSLPSNFPGEERFFVVCGGDNKDYDQLKLSLIKVFCPTSENQDENVQQNAFIGTKLPATQAGLEQFNGPPEAGTVVCGTRNLGDPTSCTIAGMPNQYFSAENVDGNSGIMDIMNFLAQDQTRSGKNRKPKVIERTVNGVLVREIQEAGAWFHALTKGLAVHAAWHPMAGQVLNEVKKIETAIQNFANIPNAGALAQLPGSIMNIASMFKGLSKSQRKQATRNMSPLLLEGLDNMIELMGNSTGGTDYVSSGRVNPEIFTQNMIDLLSQVDNISDLVDAIQRLQYDETLRGLESYAQKANSGLTANSIVSTGETLEYSVLKLSDDVETSIHYFDDGYSLNIASNTYVVLTADQSSNTINVFPKIEQSFTDQTVYVYLPVAEIETEGPYGPMTMTIDMNGNISPNRNTAQKIQQAMQAIQGLMNSAQGGLQNLFGDASGIMSQLFNRIPNNIRATVLSEIANVAKAKLDDKHKNNLRGIFPFGG